MRQLMSIFLMSFLFMACSKEPYVSPEKGMEKRFAGNWVGESARTLVGSTWTTVEYSEKHNWCFVGPDLVVYHAPGAVQPDEIWENYTVQFHPPSYIIMRDKETRAEYLYKVTFLGDKVTLLYANSNKLTSPYFPLLTLRQTRKD